MRNLNLHLITPFTLAQPLFRKNGIRKSISLAKGSPSQATKNITEESSQDYNKLLNVVEHLKEQLDFKELKDEEDDDELEEEYQNLYINIPSSFFVLSRQFLMSRKSFSTPNIVPVTALHPFTNSQMTNLPPVHFCKVSIPGTSPIPHSLFTLSYY